MSTPPIADLYLVELLAPGSSGRALPPFMSAVLTVWNNGTGQNTVVVGSGGTARTYTDLPVCNPAGLVLGPVLLARTEGAPVIMGPLIRYIAPGLDPETGD